MELINTTRFAGQLVVLPDKDGFETLVAVLKGTFAIGRGECVPAEEQAPIVAADEFNGKPGESSTKYESDLAPHKPATDVVLLGHAHAPKPGTRHVDVSLSVGPVKLAARVHGDRRWGYVLGIARITGPEPFEKIPLVFERAFGGVQPSKDGEGAEGAEQRNPLGVGYVKKKRRSYINGLALPNVEDPRRPIKRLGNKPPPVGFGFVGRHWFPRRRYLGTYDAAWKADRLPLLPRDFNDRAWCGAPAALQASPHLVGGEPVRAASVSANGPLDFRLPATRPTIEAHWGGSWTPLAPLLDTVVIEPDSSRVCMTWRASLRIHGRVREMRAVRMTAAI